jgi:methanogenic corrinoid protein MtbC1
LYNVPETCCSRGVCIYLCRREFAEAVVNLDEKKALGLARKRFEVGEDHLKVLDDLTNIIGK